MNHGVKASRKRRHWGLKLGFCLAGIWAAGLLCAAGWLLWLEPRGQARSVTLSFRGEEQHINAAGLTAAEALRRLNLSLTPEDVVSPELSTVLTGGMTLTVTRHTRAQENFTISLPAETEYRLDASLPWGEEKLLEPGVPGQLLCHGEVEYINGQAASREITGKELLNPPTARVVAVGTREEETPLLKNGCLWLPEGQALPCTKSVTLYLLRREAGSETKVLTDGTEVKAGTRLYLAAADGSRNYGFFQAVTTADGAAWGLSKAGQTGAVTCIVYFLG